MKKALVIHIVNSTFDKEKKFKKLSDDIKKISNTSIKEIKSPDFSLLTEDERKNVINNLPAGTCICITMFEQKESRIIVCLPAFSSHLKMPLKKGEYVWFFEDESTYSEDDTNKDTYIKNFWFSRIHGLKISEDPTFSFHERDYSKSIKNDSKGRDIIKDPSARSKLEQNKKKKKLKNSIILPNFESSFTQTYNKNMKLSHDILIDKDTHLSYYPRYYDDNNSITLQGSGNAYININSDCDKLSKKGGIDIVAGRISELKSIEEVLKTKKFKVLNSEEKETEKKEFEYNEVFPFIYVENSIGEKEILKDVNFYFTEKDSFKTNNKIENNISKKMDSSRLYVCERDNLDNSFDLENFVFYQTNLNKDFDESIHNKVESYKKKYPSILQKTNKIRIVARESYKDTEIDKSSIRIIKNSNKYKDYSHILLEDNGNILFDGNKILIGDFKRSALYQKVISENDIKDIIENKKSESDFSSNFEKMSGMGEEILIGYSKKYSEPLVLGNSLVSVLEELININIKLIDELSKALTKIDNHVHTVSGPGTSPPIPTMLTLAENASIKIEKSKIEDIKKNLNKLLSKVAKTS